MNHTEAELSWTTCVCSFVHTVFFFLSKHKTLASGLGLCAHFLPFSFFLLFSFRSRRLSSGLGLEASLQLLLPSVLWVLLQRVWCDCVSFWVFYSEFFFVGREADYPNLGLFWKVFPPKIFVPMFDSDINIDNNIGTSSQNRDMNLCLATFSIMSFWFQLAI